MKKQQRKKSRRKKLIRELTLKTKTQETNLRNNTRNKQIKLEYIADDNKDFPSNIAVRKTISVVFQFRQSKKK